MIKTLEKIFYILAFISILISIWMYQTNETLGIFIGLWVPTLLLILPACPFRKE